MQKSGGRTFQVEPVESSEVRMCLACLRNNKEINVFKQSKGEGNNRGEWGTRGVSEAVTMGETGEPLENSEQRSDMI